MAEEEKRIERCFWCGRPKSGPIEETEETINNSVITNYQPCPLCKEEFSKGIHVIGVTEKPIVDGMFPIMKDDKNTLYPTGSMFVAQEDFIKDMLSEESEKELLENVLKERVILLRNEMVEQIVEDARAAGNENELVEDYKNKLEKVAGEENAEEVQSQSNEESMD